MFQIYTISSEDEISFSLLFFPPLSVILLIKNS